jgi:lysophospholipase
MEFYPVAGNDVPEGLVAGELVTPDGTRLRYGLCRRGEALRGTVCVFEGRSEFIEKYFETVEDLSARGFAVAVLDWRGQGGSTRRLANPFRGHVTNFRRYDEDLAAFMTGVVLPDCPPPYYGLAHSTGGLVVLRALATRNWFLRVVLSSPLIDFAPMSPPRPIVRALAKLAVWCGLGRLFVPGQPRRPLRQEDFPGNRLSSDLVRFARAARTTDEAPGLGSGGPTFAWLNAAFNAIGALERQRATSLFLARVLIVAARDDRVVSVEAIRRFASRRPGVAAVIIDRARHELLQERNEVREQFWAAFDTFIDGSALAGAQAAQVSRRARASS